MSFLADIKYSTIHSICMVYIARITTDLYCNVEFVSVTKASRFVTIEFENHSQTPLTSDISAIEVSARVLY